MQNRNTNIIKRIFNAFKIQDESAPSEVSDDIQLTYNVEPTLSVWNAEADDATSAIILSVPNDKDFYLCGAHLTTKRDATATAESSFIQAYADGKAIQLCRLNSRTLLSVTQGIVSDAILMYPIKIDRGTDITVNNSTNVADIETHGTIYGYFD